MPNADLAIPFRVESVSQPLHQVFADLVTATQTAALRVNFEVNRSQARVQDLERENAELRQQNQKLQDEISHLKAQLAGQRPVDGARFSGQPEPSELFVLDRTIKAHSAPVHSVSVAADSNIFATASWDATVKLYDLAADSVVQSLGGPDAGEGVMGGLYAVAFAKTAPEILGCTSCDRTIYLWNRNEGKLLAKLAGHTDEVNGLDFHPSQQVMCSASDDMKVIIWDFKEGLILRTLDRHPKGVYGATFLGQENQFFVATCCNDGQARIFDMRDKQIAHTLSAHGDEVIGINYNSAKQCLATGSDDGHICIWDTRTWTLQQQINTKALPNLQDNEVKRVSFTTDGHYLAAGCSSGRVLVYDIAGSQARLASQLGGHSNCVFDVAWGKCPRSGKRILVSASHDDSSKVWREA